MKTVGIITVHRYHNYGSALQAYATQRIFEQLGYEAFIIDYKCPEIIYATEKYMDYDSRDDSFYRILENEKCKSGILKSVVKKVFSVLHISQFLYAKLGVVIGMDLFTIWLNNLRMTRSYNTLNDLYLFSPQFDVLVVGGDQLWNTHITYNNPAFYLTFANDVTKRIAFSTSIGIPTIPKAALDTFKKGINNLSSILLREEEGVEYLRSMGYKADRVLDPTLILTKSEWSMMQNLKYCVPFPKYILAYFLDPTEWTNRLLGVVREQKNLPVIIIGGKRKGYSSKETFYTGAIEVATFLTLFAHAEIVVTNSFHGMAFTLLFEKILVATYRSNESEKSMNSRHRNFVELFGLSSCLYRENSFSPQVLSYEMDYARINVLLDGYREHSIDLLRKALN